MAYDLLGKSSILSDCCMDLLGPNSRCTKWLSIKSREQTRNICFIFALLFAILRVLYGVFVFFVRSVSSVLSTNDHVPFMLHPLATTGGKHLWL